LTRPEIMLRSPSSQSGRRYVLVLIAVHLAIALPLAYFLNIWSDEASTLYATQKGFLVAFQTAATEQKQAPLYFWIMSLWRGLNDSIFFARCFSAAASVASIWLFSSLAARLLRHRVASAATTFLALHPILLWASLEIRVYSLVILLTIALTHVFIDAFWFPARSRYSRWAFLALSIVALYTNYYLGFLLVGFCVALVLFGRWRELRTYLATMLLVGVAFLPMALHIRTEFQSRAGSFQEARSLLDGVRTVWSNMVTFLLPADILHTSDESSVSLIRLWLLRAFLMIIGVAALINRRRVSAETFLLGAMTATIAVWLVTAYFLVGSWLVEFRHATVIFAPLVLLVTSLINDLLPEREPSSHLSHVVAAAPAAVVLAFFGYAMFNLYPGLTKTGDWERVGTYIQNNERPDQPIIIFHTYDALALPYYYHGVNRIMPDEGYFDFFGTQSVERIEKRSRLTLSKIPPDANELWLLTTDECSKPQVCTFLNEYVAVNYDRVSETNFYKQTVTLLRKKQIPAAAVAASMVPARTQLTN
jgi:hypothetical protein